MAGPNVRQPPKEDVGPYYQRGLNAAAVVLQSMLNEIETFWSDELEPYSVDFWPLIHPEIALVAKARFESGQYADCAEAALKDLNAIIKEEVRNRTGQEHDGASLMRKAFSVNNPIFTIDTLLTETGKSIQQGYMEIFAGSMTGIRNPKAHMNIKIGRERAIHFIFLASLLMDTYDMANNNYRYGT